MEFEVKRTSLGFIDNSPCEGAYQKYYMYHDVRTTDDPIKFAAYAGRPDKAISDWYGSGENHRIVNGRIVRDFRRKGWFIKINSLKALIDFQGRYGDIIITNMSDISDQKTIEIYDDYRE